MMTEGDISTTDEAFAYVTDCCLATVELLAAQKTRSRLHYKRHISIAQTHIRLAKSFDIDLSETRAIEVIEDFGGDVAAWAKDAEGVE